MAPHSAPPLPDPITSESAAADTLELLLDLDDIVDGSVLLLLCDRDLRPVTPVLISDVPSGGPETGTLEGWFERLGSHFGDDPPGVIFARARPGQSFVLDEDRQWHDAISRACAVQRMPLHWSFVVTQHAVVPFPAPPAHRATG